MQNRFPNFFVVGAAKSGTTALYHLLDRHPEIFLSPIKEPNHFCTDITPERFSPEYALHEKRKKLDLDAYLAGPMRERHFDYYVTRPEQYALLFRNVTTEKAVGEMSNSYLFSEAAAANIRRAVPHARIVMVLRNPVDRIFSHYLAHLRDGKTRLDFREEIDRDFRKPEKGWWISHCYYEAGLYAEQVRRYYEAFDRDRIRIIRYEDFRDDPARVLHGLFRFLGVGPGPGLDTTGTFNASLEPRSRRLVYLISRLGIKKRLFRMVPAAWSGRVKRSFFRTGHTLAMSPQDRAALAAFYRDDIEKLEALTGLDLGGWKSDDDG